MTNSKAVTRRGKTLAKRVPPDAAESEQHTKPTASVVEASWGAIPLELEQVRKILSEEDGLLDINSWAEENREALEIYNDLVKKHGAFSDGLRGF